MFREYLAITVFGLVVQLIGIGLGQTQSPCPEIFKYVRNGQTGDIEGFIEINGVPNGVSLVITVEISFAAALSMRNGGRLNLAESKEQAIESIRRGRPLTYRLQFPIQRPLPVITSISFNNQEYCPGRPATGQIIGTMKLQHTLFPPTVVQSVQVPNSFNFDPSPGSIEIERPNFVSGQNSNLPSDPTSYIAAASNEDLTPPMTGYFMRPVEQVVPSQGSTVQMQSPCSDVFKYVRDQSTGDIEGHIEIHGVPNGVPLYISVELSIAASLPTKYVGRLGLAVPKEQAINEIRQGRPLVYRVFFPIQRPVPIVTRILFNDQDYCTGKRAMGHITSVGLKHTLMPGTFIQSPISPTHVQPSSSYPKPTQVTSMISRPVSTWPDPVPIPTHDLGPVKNSDLQPKPVSTSPPASSQSSVLITEHSLKPTPYYTPTQNLDATSSCGRPTTGDINLLISKGDKTEPGEWPWLVAIFIAKIKLEFQCGGSLISNKHVITAAHCLINDNRPLPPSTILAVVGRYKLRAWSEKGSVISEISEFHIHTEYMKIKGGFDNDLAIMTLRETVTFGKFIMPVCLWSGSVDLQGIVGKTGFVAGWGRDEQENPTTEEPRKIRVPIVSQEECLRSNRDFVSYTSNRTLCGGARNGSGPCNGDSGGGLVIYDRETKRYQLRGVVSLSLLDRAAGACDLKNFVVYTDAAKHMDWIMQNMAT